MLKNYEQFADEMILRDYLAVDRTFLANERTLLAYVRTFVALFASGVGLINFTGASLWAAIGHVFIAVSPFFAIYGAVKYAKTLKKLKTLGEKN